MSENYEWCEYCSATYKVGTARTQVTIYAGAAGWIYGSVYNQVCWIWNNFVVHVYVLWRFISSGILHYVGRCVVCCISKDCNSINLWGTTHPTTVHTQQHYTPNNTTHPTALHTQQHYTPNNTTHTITHWIFNHMALRVSNLTPQSHTVYSHPTMNTPTRYLPSHPPQFVIHSFNYIYVN
jgi:hypothetical protein